MPDRESRTSDARSALNNEDDSGHQRRRRALRRHPRAGAALRTLGEVMVVAPHIEASAIGHALTLRRPLRDRAAARRRLRGGRHADRLRQHRASRSSSRRRPISIVSGINKGYNLGDDVTYSGTVAGAMEGALLGDSEHRGVAGARRAAPTISARGGRRGGDRRAVLRERALPARTFLNLNVPAGKPKGIAHHRAGEAQPRHRRRS